MKSSHNTTSETPKAAVALIQARDSSEILILKRAEHPNDPWSGHLALPGGRYEEEDQDLCATSIRETYEECGLTLKREECISEMGIFFAGHYIRKNPIPVMVYAFEIPSSRVDLKLDPKEVAASYWVKESSLNDFSQHELHAFYPDQPSIKKPAIKIEGTFLWGFTYNVIKQHYKWPNIE
ncbi:MAG: NUDIX domain-containing protein [Planctomycetes bacterium]|nr:NUDIX domain-containing protein [Planctomycetota bacterium]